MKIATHTLGCRLNQAESDIIETSLSSAGHQIVTDWREADIVVVNTCTVTARGDRDARKFIHRIRRENPGARIAVVGCQAQLQAQTIAGWNAVHWIIGNAAKLDVAQIIAESPTASEDAPVVRLDAISRSAFTLPLPAFTRHTRANVKIQDGCNCKCAYCTIPSARGPSRSRQFEDILREVDALLERGYREIVFTGINIGTYHDGSRRLLQLIEAVLANSSVERLRLSSLEPAMIPKGLLELMKRYEGRLCRHLHIALQSGSPATLKRMNRPYPLEKIVAFIHKAVETIPQLAVGVDVIAGFPGEDEHEFEETCQTLRNLPIAYGHVFSFSERPHAPITAQPDIPRVDPRTIQERNRILREIVAAHKRRFLETLCRDQASPLRVLVEQYRAPYWEGHTDHYVQVCIQAPESAALRNEILDVLPLSLQDERILAVPQQNSPS